jgi:hypothetical protein
MQGETRSPATQGEGFWSLAQGIFNQRDRETHDLPGFIYLRASLPQDTPGALTVHSHPGVRQDPQRTFMHLGYLCLTEDLNLGLHIAFTS